MKNIKIILVSFLLFIFSAASFAQGKALFEAEGFTELFNGKDLTGWKTSKDEAGIPRSFLYVPRISLEPPRASPIGPSSCTIKASTQSTKPGPP